jgi:hypothetical protein
MNTEIAKQWIEALRSDKFKQTDGCLTNSIGGYCCLGVLCELYNRKYGTEFDEFGQLFDEGEILPKEVKDWAGMNTSDGSGFKDTGIYSLADLNDRGTSFKEISDIIEEHWEQL